MKKRILNILFWSVISAAFIGPGTITTASRAGAEFGFSLLWALVFSTIACLVLQEAVARITIYSGRSLGEAIYMRYKKSSSQTVILVLIIGAIVLGSAAYETGNILGAVAGVQFLIPWNNSILVLSIGVLAIIALSLPSLRNIAHLMGYVVVIMGVSFVTTAIMLKPDFGAILQGSVIPVLPDNRTAGILVLGLIGTTVVPYNLFLGSGIAGEGQTIREMRFGLSVAIIIGGLISMSVLVTGSFVEGDFSFEALVKTLDSALGRFSVWIFGIGMLAAGFSSAITAPLASALTAKSLFSGRRPGKWSERSFNFRAVWGFVLLVGIGFGLAEIKPIPAIIMAQALNGLILPFISIFLVFIINDPNIMGKDKINGLISNTLLMIVVWITLLLGILNIFKAIQSVFLLNEWLIANAIMLNYILSTLIWFGVIVQVYRIRMKGSA
jgi:Mn2+/Fe2+ NRAMP family transporter